MRSSSAVLNKRATPTTVVAWSARSDNIVLANRWLVNNKDNSATDRERGGQTDGELDLLCLLSKKDNKIRNKYPSKKFSFYDLMAVAMFSM